MSGAVVSQLSPSDLHLLRSTQADIARRVSWAGARTSHAVILWEVGWTPIDVRLVKAKLGLAESIKALPDREYAKHIWNVRTYALGLHNASSGFVAEIRLIWEDRVRTGMASLPSRGKGLGQGPTAVGGCLHI